MSPKESISMFKSLYLVVFTALFLTLPSLALEKVTLQLQWKHQFEFAGFYMAKEKGFYKDVGLDVDFVEYNSHDKDTVDKVLEGEVDYGLSYASIISQYMKGKPIVFVANFFKQSPLIILAQSYIKMPQNLKGKTIMGSTKSIDTITLTTMLSKFNVHTDDIKSVPASYSIDDFIAGKVDAMAAFSTNEPYALSQAGISYNIFDPTVYGAEYYDLNLFTSLEKAEKKPKQVRKFKTASIRGWEYALAHKEETVDLILSKYNSQHKSKKALLFEANEIENIMLPKVHTIGSIDKNRVKLIAESFIQAGFVQNKQYQFEDFLFEHQESTPQEIKKDLYLYLTEEEKKFLAHKEKIHMCVDPDYMPYEKITNGKHVGITADYMHHLSTLLHLPIKMHMTKSWDRSLVAFKDGECDILSLVAQTTQRHTFIDFTKPYLSSPLVIATQLDKSFISSMESIKGKKIGVVRNYASSELLRGKYLDLSFVEVKSSAEGLKRVANGELFGFIDTLTTISYQIQKRFPTQLKISGQLKENLDMSIGVQKNQPLLLEIFNKAVGITKESTKKNILNHWVTVKFEKSDPNILTFWKILLPVLLIALLLLMSQYAMRRYNNRLKERVKENIEELHKKDELLVQQHRMAAMGEMLSMISHQWKQPLGAISSSIMGIKIKIDSGKFDLSEPLEQKKFISYLDRKHESILEYVNYLTHTTDDFRNFFNPGKNKELTSLSSPIENALNIVQKSLEKNGIEVIIDFKTEAKLMMYPNEVMQVILNLIKNSEDNFLEKKTLNPKIMIATFLKEESYMIRVCDNGGGIKEETAQHIFEPYFSTKTNKMGTGLGLYMSKIIIEDHHYGSLLMRNVSSSVCFELIFPRPKVEA